jgi:hypothetical protein
VGADRVLINPDGDKVAAGGLATDAHAAIMGSWEGGRSYGMVGGTSLASGKTLLLSGSAPFNVGVRVSAARETAAMEAEIEMSAETTVSLAVQVEPKSIKIDGQETAGGTVYDAKTKTVGLVLPAGRHTLLLN